MINGLVRFDSKDRPENNKKPDLEYTMNVKNSKEVPRRRLEAQLHH